MHCPYCGKKIPDNVRVCGYCGNHLDASPPSPQPAPPTQIIVQSSSSQGLFSSLTGLINFALGALVIGLLVFIMLVFLCVIRLPSNFPVFDLPNQLDVLWSRAVALQAQTCTSSSGTQPNYEPPIEQPAPIQPQPIQPEPPQPPACNSDMGEEDCEAAGGDYRYIFMDPGPNIYMCICP